jgi:hypothetical protein
MTDGVQIHLSLSNEEAAALHDMLDRHLSTLQYLEKNQPQNVSDQVELEKHSVIHLIMAIDSAMRRGSMQ